MTVLVIIMVVMVMVIMIMMMMMLMIIIIFKMMMNLDRSDKGESKEHPNISCHQQPLSQTDCRLVGNSFYTNYTKLGKGSTTKMPMGN